MIDEVKNSGKAVASLVLGICGWFIPFGGYVLDILAIIFGAQARSAIKRSNGKLSGEGMAIAGLVLGIVGLGITTLVLMAVLGTLGLSIGFLNFILALIGNLN
ncbi:MAG: DUF4190 domain-containing protein [Candidatus Stahlbacteria bacterium]|nr:DUF4190 domain-containing protein [Candidatus Stahlbacteria bacterium]